MFWGSLLNKNGYFKHQWTLNKCLKKVKKKKKEEEEEKKREIGEEVEKNKFGSLHLKVNTK